MYVIFKNVYSFQIRTNVRILCQKMGVGYCKIQKAV